MRTLREGYPPRGGRRGGISCDQLTSFISRTLRAHMLHIIVHDGLSVLRDLTRGESKEVGEEERGAQEEWTGGATTPHPSMLRLIRIAAVTFLAAA